MSICRPLHSTLLSALLLAAPAQALQITQLSPQGEVAQVRQVLVRFDAKAVNFGDAQAPAPVQLRCSDARASAGQGRWNSEREWVFNFRADLPPGVQCQVQREPGFRAPGGTAVTGPASWRFSTGGPFVRTVEPYESATIDEEQAFILTLNGEATPQSLREHVWCVSEGVGERLPVRLIEGAERQALLAARHLDKAAQAAPQRYVTLACNRRLAPASKLQLVWGAGVATPSGVVNRVEKRFAWTVREPFKASFSCERENAQAACMPIRPMTLTFNAPLPRKLAEGVRLQAGREALRPQIDPQEARTPDALVESVSFPGPFDERASYSLTLPDGLQDAAGRTLANAASFPLAVQTAALPPLAKFASGSFGIIERFAEGPNGPALLPLTLRRVEPAPGAQQLALAVGTLQQISPQDDAAIIGWWRKLQTYDRGWVSRDRAKQDVSVPLPKSVHKDRDGEVESRMLPLLAGQRGVQALTLPQPAAGDKRPFEVIGVPLQPGFHVLEIGSRALGDALLDKGYGQTRTMYVRTGVLVTNLAVHFKLGREGSLAWVTTLDQGKPVAGAQVRVSTCAGRLLASGNTDAQGVVRFKDLSPEAPECPGADEDGGWSERGYFVSARAPSTGAGADTAAPDLAFTWTHWQRGIESWRFNVPTSDLARPDALAHTVFDRTLLRAGETVSMKHLLRTQTASGFGLPKTEPTRLVIRHVGSGQEFVQPLNWRRTPTGGRSAESSFAIPAAAPLGAYHVTLRSADDHVVLLSGQFRVEAFRLPVLRGQVAPQGSEPLIGATRVPVQVQVQYLNGGAASGLPVRVSALVRARTPRFTGYDDFSFDPPRSTEQAADAEAGDDAEQPSPASAQRVVADKLALTLNREGVGQTQIESIASAPSPRELLLEATYADPNGEVQTVRHTQTLWPAAVVAGVRTEGWVGVKAPLAFQALALNVQGQPQAGAALSVKAVARTTYTTRKRLVGGFYSYDSTTELRDLGTVCTGQADARGLLLCNASLKQPGEVDLIVTATDAAGRTAQASTTVWVADQDELWFGGRDDDRMDVLPEKRQYAAGETARLQVRMPFRRASALLAIEREGVLETRVLELSGKAPVVELPIRAEWGPNVYVSVLAIRGRVYEVPWYSFFTWGWRSPGAWWQAFWNDSQDYVPPSALVDLSKPAYRFGMAELQIGHAAHAMKVSVSTDQPSYPVRGTARVTLHATLPNGQPAAGAEVALAAVDQALLELMPNQSWKLLDAMMQRRAWGVQTATAQMEIVGRRHYGRKALPAGGGGGGSPTRELFDTLLLWRPALVLDAQGLAQIEVPLNDALTRFRIVAVADAGTGAFGTGEATIDTRQDLQLISGLPPLVRGGDRFDAMLTLRNTTAQPMDIEVTPQIEGGPALAPRQIALAAGASGELSWPVQVPPEAGTQDGAGSEWAWTLSARDRRSGAQDRVALRQRVLPALPLAVQQATLVPIEGEYQLDVAPPAGAVQAAGSALGGLRLALVPSLAEGLPGVRDWFGRYPYSCLEQQASRALALHDAAAWRKLTATLPTYTDRDGLLSYFPPTGGDAARGSDTLTAYLLAATHEAASQDPALALPDATADGLQRALIAFVEGRIERKSWSPRPDLDARKLAAIEALSRYGKATPRMLESITVAPNQWPTHAVIDWLNILRRVQGVPKQEQRLAEAQQILRARLNYQGSKLVFSTETDDAWWWLMQGGDVNSARLLLAVLTDPAWKDDRARIASGFIARQQNGAWHTTTANLWGALALQKFARVAERGPVSGRTTATLDEHSASIDWAQVRRASPTDAQGQNRGTYTGDPLATGWRGNTARLPWPPGDAARHLTVTHSGSGQPWLTLQALAAVPRSAPLAAGYSIRRKVEALEPSNPKLPAGQYTRGDLLRVTLDIDASADMTWVAITDPIPSGATILGSGLGRDSEIATQGEKRSGAAWGRYEERAFDAYRAYYEYLPKGRVSLQYTVRLNNPGQFQLPPSRAEALYAPEMFGEAPNAPLTVLAAQPEAAAPRP